MTVAALDHINLTVRDLPASLAWYGRVLGFERRESGVKDGVPWAIVQSGQALLCLYEHPDREFVDHHELGRRGLHGLNHLGLRIEDRAAWEATIDREGLELLYGGVVEWPHSSAWYLLDPTGYELEVAFWHDGSPSFRDAASAAGADPWSRA